MELNLHQESALHLSEVLAIAHERATLPARGEERYVHTVLGLARYVDTLGALRTSHISRTAVLAKALGRRLGLSSTECENLSLAGLLHDVGKIFVPEAILVKPEHLDDSEWTIMRQHPAMGVRILRPARQFNEILSAVMTHHEKYDGSGYPAGLAGNAIPLEGRIITLTDAFAAMTGGRIYRSPLSTDEALLELRHCAGSHFDPYIVDAFTRMVKDGEI